MKILHVSPSYIPAYRYGGSVKAVHELCRELVIKGMDVSVFTTNIDFEGNTLAVPTNEVQYIEGVKVVYFPARHLKYYCFSRDLATAVKENIEKFDIAHIHSVFLYPTLVAGYWCRKKRIPYIINSFGAIDPAMLRLRSYVKKALYIKFIERRNLNKANFIHAASAYEKERIRSLGFKAPIAVIPRGLRLEDYSARRETNWLKQKFPHLVGKKLVLFLGRIHQKKGLDLLAQVMKKLVGRRKDIYLIIAGAGEEDYVKEVKALFEKSGVMEQVLFLGMLLDEEKINAFYASDVFVLPSYGENFGIAVLEAMACGVPVVVTERVGLHPDVAEYGAGFVTPCDADAVAEAILRLLNDEELARETGSNGRRLVEDRFVLSNVADEMVKIYERALEK